MPECSLEIRIDPQRSLELLNGAVIVCISGKCTAQIHTRQASLGLNHTAARNAVIALHVIDGKQSRA